MNIQATALRETHGLLNLGNLIDSAVIVAQTGHDIREMSYGTSGIPFIRTSDFSNWEVKADAKQGIDEEIYQ